MINPDESDWLAEVLDEVGLQQFHSKLTNDLQLTKLSHFDFVSEEDLIQLGLSKPAARRLLAAIKKRKSSVIFSALKNRIVNKFIPSSSSLSNSTTKTKHHHDLFIRDSPHQTDDSSSSSKRTANANSDFSRLTCLINSQDIQIKEEIGHGVHGFVKKGEWNAPNGRVVEVALKILKKDVMAEPGASFNDFVKEISVMHQLNHPNIIKLYGVVLSSPMMMVTELAPFGNLRDKLRKEEGRTPISQLINFGVQIASGMEYLESKRFVHRDLAARNIFISHGKKILIGDLGLMRAIPNQENHYVMSERTKIPYPWCAPESLRFKQFSSSSDVYMFGVTLWEMFSFGKEPWANLNLNQILENISSQSIRLPCPEACPAMVYQTLLQCWNTDPSSRPNFSTLYQYLSTSYPLEVRSTQHISDLNTHKGIDSPRGSNDLTNSYSALNNPEDSQNKLNRKVLNCNVDDRILVIDGQPEKYWWKGQNLRTFEIGWFPLCSTRWLAPKRGSNYISKPLKNSFVHTGHCGADGKWGSPKFIDQMYLKNPLEPNDISCFNAIRVPNSSHSNFSKSKARLKLSRLFGINDTNSSSHIVNHAYQKFKDEPHRASLHSKKGEPLTGGFKDFWSRESQLALNEEHHANGTESKTVEDVPPLIDLSDDQSVVVSESASNSIDTTSKVQQQQESLIDMDFHGFNPLINDIPQRRASDTNLRQLDDMANYHLSWAGSWNTGTFDGSQGNIYSAYYCPQDAASAIAPGNKKASAEIESNRYYSAVTQEDGHLRFS